jgi:hypothetical protein
MLPHLHKAHLQEHPLVRIPEMCRHEAKKLQAMCCHIAGSHETYGKERLKLTLLLNPYPAKLFSPQEPVMEVPGPQACHCFWCDFGSGPNL